MRQKHTLIIVALLATIACGGGSINPVPTTVPPAVTGTAEQLAFKALTILDASAIVVRNTGRLYLQTSQGIVPPDIDAKIRAGFVAFADEGQRATAKIRTGLASWDEIKVAVEPVLKAANNLVTLVNQIRSAQSSTGWLGMLQSAVEILNGIQPASRPSLGGVR
jgi:hypothetical protein